MLQLGPLGITLKTLLGFLRTVIRTYVPMGSRAGTIEEVYNYLPISAAIATSGQPSEAQFAAILAAGYRTVINLAPHTAKNALRDEQGLLDQLGMRYVHIPVEFTAPTTADFNKFVDAMQHAVTEKVWVHCAANMRVSAFMYKYRRDVLQEDPAVAKAALNKIWEPNAVWKKFLWQ